MSAAAATSPSKSSTLRADYEDFKKQHASEVSGLQLDDGLVTGKLIEGKFEFVLDCSNYPQETLYLEASKTYKGNFSKFGDKLIEDLEKAASKSKKSKKKNGSDDEGSGSDISIASIEDDGSSNGGLRESGGWRTDSNASIDPTDEPINELRWQDNENLMLDIHNFKVLFGDKGISVRGMPLLELVEIDMTFTPTAILTAQTAQAWGVDPSLPLVIRIAFNDTHYTDMHKPTQTIEVFQLEKGKRLKCGVKSQLENILRNFLKDYWPSSTSFDTHATKLDEQAVGEAKKNAQKETKGKLKKSGFFSWVFGGDKSDKEKEKEKDQKPKPQEPAKGKSPQKNQVIDIEKVRKLTEMGFSEDASFQVD